MHERVSAIEHCPSESNPEDELPNTGKQRAEAGPSVVPSSSEPSNQTTEKPTAGPETSSPLSLKNSFSSDTITGATRKPVSSKQHEANGGNAKLSTGPRTERGKRWSRRNATKHGICSRTEDSEEFQALYSALCAEYKTVGVLEELPLREITHSWLQIDRLRRFEREAIRRASQSATGTLLPSTLPELMELLSIVQSVKAEPQDDSQNVGEEFGGLELVRCQHLALFKWQARRCQAGSLDLPQREEELDSTIGLSELPLAHDLDLGDRYERRALRNLAFFTDLLERSQRARKKRTEEVIDVPASL